MFLEKNVKTENFFSNPLFSDGLFGDLSLKSSQSLSLIKKAIRKRQGETFISKGDMPNRIYTLREGQAQMTLNAEPEKKLFVRLIEANEILGLTEALANLPFEMDVRTITPCLFEYIPRRAFINFLRDKPEICFRLLKTLGSDYQKNYELFISHII